MAPSRSSSLGLLLLAAWLPSESACLAVGARVPGRVCALARPPAAARAAAAQMIEAFDLVPVVDCLKLDGMDAVQACMDRLEPWMSINDEGDVAFSLNALNGFIGGSVGVVGTVISTMIKKEEVKGRLKCNYCNGSGQIVCGHCLGQGQKKYFLESATIYDGSTVQAMACDNCEQTGTVVCINCQGSGISVPEDFLQMLGDEEIGFTESDYIGLFDETPIPGRPIAAPDKAEPPVTVGGGRGDGPTDAEATQDAGPKATDYTGGMG